MARATEPSFLGVFRSSGGNNTEIMHKQKQKQKKKGVENYYIRVEFAEYYQK